MHKSTMSASCMITLTYSGHKTWWIHGRGCRQAPSSLENAQLCDLYDCINLIGSQVVMCSWERYRQTPLNLLDAQISKNCFLYDYLNQIASSRHHEFMGEAASKIPLKQQQQQLTWRQPLSKAAADSLRNAWLPPHSLCTNWVEYGNLIIFS